jgi:hypothetical protein
MARSIMCFYGKLLGIVMVIYSFVMGGVLNGEPQLKVEIVTNPKPTHFEKNYVTLQLVKEITGDIDDNHFFAKPVSLTVDNEGGIYFYDSKLKKIFKFNKHYKLECTFGRQGQGPGEFTGNDFGFKKIYYSNDGYIYVRAQFNGRILVYDKKGKHVEDIAMARVLKGKTFLPVVDEKKDIYALSSGNAAIDVYNKKMKLSDTLLERADYYRYLFYRVVNESKWSRTTNEMPNIFNTYYDVLPGDGLIVFLANSSRVFILKNRKVINQFDTWPDKSINAFKKRFVDKHVKNKKEVDFFTPHVSNLFLDKDDPRFFYLVTYGGIYKFDITGHLIHVLDVKVKNGYEMIAKRNGLFYAIGGRQENIKIFKIKEIKK